MTSYILNLDKYMWIGSMSVYCPCEHKEAYESYQTCHSDTGSTLSDTRRSSNKGSSKSNKDSKAECIY